MGRQGNKYEQTTAFIIIPFIEDQEGQLTECEHIYLQDTFILPISKKTYKVTLKNVDVFIKEFLEDNPTIDCVRLDRISHVKIYER